MRWTQTVRRLGPRWVSDDGHGTIQQVGRNRFFLQNRRAPSGKRMECFESLGEAKTAYQTGDLSAGLRTRRNADRAAKAKALGG